MCKFAYSHIISEDIIESFYGYDKIFIDDGHYSIYECKDALSDLKIPISISIASNLIRKKNVPGTNCTNYMMEHFLHNNNKSFLSWDEIKELKEEYNFNIVAHSHFHDLVPTLGTSNLVSWRYLYLNNYGYSRDVLKLLKGSQSKLKSGGYCIHNNKLKLRNISEVQEYIIQDTELMLESFNKFLNFIPTTYVYPYNDECFLQLSILKTYGFNNFIGRQRDAK